MKYSYFSTSFITLTNVNYYAIIITIMLHILCIPISSSLHPIVLVPGSGGNQLEARLTAKYKPSSLICRAYPGPLHKDKDGWYRIWFDASVLLAPYTKCFAERMMLHYDPVSDDYFNAPGVETRVPHFGSTQSLSYLDPNLKLISGYMAPLVESLEEIGYIESKTLFGASYDFRYGLAPEGRSCHVGSKYLQDLKDLIENASAVNGGKPVVIISHSLGGLFVHQLLLRNTLSWREKYIKHFIALSTPWGGTIQEMLTFASGYTLGVPLVKPLLVREEQRSSESNLWLMPCPRIFGHSKSLVITPNANYTAKDIPKFLADIGFSQGVYPYKTRVLPMVEKLTAPKVPITCIIGSGVDTPETLFYDDKGFDKQPSIIWGDGDGTVNLLSLLAVQSEWMNEKNQPLKIININGVSHTSVLSDHRSLDQILEVVSEVNSDVLESNCLINGGKLKNV
ncbi:lecithin-cholesterol acyltransferase-like 1 [Chenopodium quinoa]|uniref:Uncharacterized protein n=1 Tax=Chenopodium quinoa TaxID=63459 RepID=A0A803MTK6_CHEQI|nr:lecithin-cholesterol acyltransferase-like 1 [Chenopodium quinoa]